MERARKVADYNHNTRETGSERDAGLLGASKKPWQTRHPPGIIVTTLGSAYQGETLKLLRTLTIRHPLSRSAGQGSRTGMAPESGYSLLEVMMAVAVSVIGLVSLLALFSQSVVTMFLVQEELIAKQKAREALESIYTARNTQASFADIETINDGGIFEDGFQPLNLSGNDGLIGTGDDGAVETLHLPGPDGLLNEGGDDVIRPLTNFERQIEISPVGSYPDLKQITVTVRYTTSQGWQRSFQASSYVSRYR